ncbi:MAG: gliding motility-associated C-terminal domain-containing protein, partial [Bacteroidales bacterium]|nr:gliding motility-associated C-terminal domain-containing protein [Bacteroidales bacterium]
CDLRGYMSRNWIAGFIADNYNVELEGSSAIINFIDQSQDAQYWLWNFSDSHSAENTSTEMSPSHEFSTAGYYKVWQTVYTDHNCRDSINRTVHVTAPFYFYIPNAFTPAKTDGLNDTFYPSGTGVSKDNYEMLIYNQWGELIFKTNERFGAWDGYYKGKLAPMGIYVYRISLRDLEDDEKIFVGTITLAR